MIHWWQRYYKFTKRSIGGNVTTSLRRPYRRKRPNKSLVAYLWPLLKRGCLWRNVPWLHRHNAQASEFMELDDLFRAAAIYADAIYR